jgi:signal transduction histidine kinase
VSIDSTATGRAAREMEAFASAVVHELRTPLCAVSGEVEIALRRERPAVAYREALTRIGARLAELVDLTGDLALLALPPDPSQYDSISAPLAVSLDTVRAHFPAMNVQVDETDGSVNVGGPPNLVARGLRLLVEHAVRHRAGDAAIRLRVGAPGAGSWAAVVIEAAAPGFLPRTWEYFAAPPDTPLDHIHSAGLLRVQAARRCLAECGGAIEMSATDDAVVVRLRRG